MTNNNKVVTIDLRLIVKRIIKEKILFLITIPLVMLLSILYIWNEPRYYTTDTKLAPEINNSGSSGTIGSLASSLGLDMSQLKNTDAITPMLYPDLMEDNKFVVELFNIPITTSNGNQYTYFDYLANHQKISWITGLLSKKQKNITLDTVSPYHLTKEQADVAETIRKDISLKVDTKDGVITITTTSQDPLISKTIADSLRTKLKEFITAYRTDKARKDVAYYKKLTQEALSSYEDARKRYAEFSDANQDVILQSIQSKTEDLENDMQLKYNTYSAAKNQYDAAKAKLQETIPVFTIIKGAQVPIKPAGPKRMIFVIVVFIITNMILVLISLRKDIKKIFI